MALSGKDYRELAEASRLQAASEVLPQRRRQHEQCAERWEMMAEKAEDTANRKTINVADQRDRPYHQR